MTLAHLCLGTASWATDQPYNDRVPPSDDELKRILAVAEAGAVRWLDTAVAYGNVHRRLREVDAWRRFQIVTKVPHADLLVDFGGYQGTEAWRAVTGGRWPVEMLGGLLAHIGPGDEMRQDARDMWAKLVYENCTRYWGASVYTPEQAMLALARGVTMLQVPWNLGLMLAASGTRRDEWLSIRDRAYAAGVLFFGRQPFARGLSVNHGAFRWALETNPRGWCVVGVETAAQVEELLRWREALQ